ncbi:MAG: (deoxy)nucleoside triphosphate pyrophosphohydrolase [Verrucomicrobia bacterium]|nr:(deoxy)nucleoside triphosphate pyrophosphohydrolase [Verrucomicrobiota bacterium]
MQFPEKNVIEVAAGLVFRDGKLLITQRCEGDHLAGLWEFPGGKRRPDESFAACLRRELHEELGIEVEVAEEVESLTHTYPDRTVHLVFLRCLWRRHEPQTIGCQAFAWVSRDELGNYAFPAADARLLGRLQASPELWR